MKKSAYIPDKREMQNLPAMKGAQRLMQNLDQRSENVRTYYRNSKANLTPLKGGIGWTLDLENIGDYPFNINGNSQTIYFGGLKPAALNKELNLSNLSGWNDAVMRCLVYAVCLKLRLQAPHAMKALAGDPKVWKTIFDKVRGEILWEEVKGVQRSLGEHSEDWVEGILDKPHQVKILADLLKIPVSKDLQRLLDSGFDSRSAREYFFSLKSQEDLGISDPENKILNALRTLKK